jgi:hypothetical protein
VTSNVAGLSSQIAGVSADLNAGAVILSVTAGEVLNGHRVVIIGSDGKAYHATNTNSDHAFKAIGITTGAANLDDIAHVQISGILVEPSWSWSASTPVWLGENGAITQDPPISPAAFSLIVATPIEATSVFIGFRDPIFIGA